jgi:hypothetical protein
MDEGLLLVIRENDTIFYSPGEHRTGKTIQFPVPVLLCQLVKT